MKLYGGINLHSNNSVIATVGETDQLLYKKRLPNNPGHIWTHYRPTKMTCKTGGRIHL